MGSGAIGMLSQLAFWALHAPVRLYNNLYYRRLKRFCVAGEGIEFLPQSAILNAYDPSALTIGKYCLAMGRILVKSPEAKIVIGDWCSFSPQSEIWAMERIEIGDRVTIGHGAQIFDNNAHSMSASDRFERYKELRLTGQHQEKEDVKTAPVRIGDDVFMGFHSAVMKGVTVGRGAVIGAGSIVTKDVPDYAIVVGNPARQVGESRP
jgi:acetyltransferase-like isoleucine patch superfamily enzyme